MGKFIIRRLLQQIPIIIGISMLLFGIFTLAPGNPLASFFTDPNMTADQIKHLEELYGLNKPKVEQYVDYVKEIILHQNMGNSMQLRQPVTKLISERMWSTFYLAFLSLIFTLLIAIPIGVISATKQYSIFDYGGTIFALMGISIPSFFFALLLIKKFSIDIRLFPISGMVTPGVQFTTMGKYLDILKHTVLPLTVLSLTGAASFMRYTRSSMLEVIRQDYIRTARAKGLKERVVIYKHALRNALIPVVTLLGMQIPVLFSGALIIEIVFVWPGMGKMQHTAVLNRDYPLMMGINLFLAVLTLFGNLIADIAYGFVDPRIKYD